MKWAIWKLISELVESGELVIFDPNTETLLDQQDIDCVCLNGEAIQISIKKRKGGEE